MREITNPGRHRGRCRPSTDALSDRQPARLVAIVLPLAIASIVLRYRRGDSIVREQLKWFVGGGLVSTGLCVALALVPRIRPIADIGWLLTHRQHLASSPIAIGIAILRYRLYEIDRIISRTLSYARRDRDPRRSSSSAVVLGLQAVLEPLTGENTIAVAASTLVVAALFQPLRRRVQRVVDRRFNRARYDAQRMAEAFAERLRDEVDITAVTVDLDATIHAALRPTTLGLWVRRDPGVAAVTIRAIVVGLAWLAAIVAAVALLILGMGPSGLFRSAALVGHLRRADRRRRSLCQRRCRPGPPSPRERRRRPADGRRAAARPDVPRFHGWGDPAGARPDEFLAALAALVGGLTVSATLIVAGAAPALVFPDGHLPSRRWRWPVGALVVAVVLSTVPNVVRPGPLGDEMPQNPFGIAGVPWVDAMLSVADVLAALTVPAALVMAIVAVVVRFRRSRAAEREQLKWFVAANLLVATFLMLAIADGSGEPTPFDVLAVASLSLPPIAIGVAILRYRLYEIDRIISRTISLGRRDRGAGGGIRGAVIGLQAAPRGLHPGRDARRRCLHARRLRALPAASAGGSSAPSIGASTGLATTGSGSSTRSPGSCETRSTSTGSGPPWSPRPTTSFDRSSASIWLRSRETGR